MLNQYLQIQKMALISFVIIIFSSNTAFAKQADNRAAAIIDNQIITYQQVNSGIEEQLYLAELKLHEVKMNKLKSMLLLRLIEAHPFSKGMQPNEFIQKYVTKNPTASDDEVQQLIDVNKVPKEKITDDFRNKAAEYIVSEKSKAALEQWFSVQSQEHGVVINLRKPERPRIEVPIGDAATFGNKNAPITIVEYSDFQCPYCARAEVTVKELLKNYKGKIRLVYKNYPLSFHGEAFIAAEAGLCAREQSEDKFWQLHDKMFDDPKGLKHEGLVSKAKTIGLDTKKFESCLKNSKYAFAVNKDIAEGNKIGVTSTPIFFINGVMVKGAQPYQAFAKIIDEELKN